MRNLVTDKELHNLYPHLRLYTINELRRRGDIPFVKIPGIRRYFYDVDEIEKWLNSLLNKPQNK